MVIYFLIAQQTDVLNTVWVSVLLPWEHGKRGEEYVLSGRINSHTSIYLVIYALPKAICLYVVIISVPGKLLLASASIVVLRSNPAGPTTIFLWLWWLCVNSATWMVSHFDLLLLAACINLLSVWDIIISCSAQQKYVTELQTRVSNGTFTLIIESEGHIRDMKWLRFGRSVVGMVSDMSYFLIRIQICAVTVKKKESRISQKCKRPNTWQAHSLLSFTVNISGHETAQWDPPRIQFTGCLEHREKTIQCLGAMTDLDINLYCTVTLCISVTGRGCPLGCGTSRI